MFRDLLYTNLIISPIWFWLLGVSQVFAWRRRKYALPAPHFIKQSTLLRYSIEESVWVETGTYLGETTCFLAKRFPFVYTIEPSQECCRLARKRFRAFDNIELLPGASEETLLPLLERIDSPSVCFWLDGHFSAGITYEGQVACPVLHELNVIASFLSRFRSVSVLVDDVRCADSNPESYPSLDVYVDWARSNCLNWTVENDIFIAQK